MHHENNLLLRKVAKKATIMENVQMGGVFLELAVIRFLQSFQNPVLDVLAEGITLLGEQIFFVLILALIYWTLHKDCGKVVCYGLFTSICFNGVVKDIVKAPRPIGQEGVFTHRAETATGYSFPSGHSQSAASFFTSLCLFVRRKILVTIAVVLVPLIGISRLYLGVHWPKDVIFGIIFGVACSFICQFLYSRISNKTLLFSVTFLVMTPSFLLDPSIDFIKTMGLFFGFIFGNLLEEKKVDFTTDIPWLQKSIRLAIGLLSLLALHLSMRYFLPHLPIFDFIRYSIISLYAFGIYPYVFKKYKF